MHEKMLTRIPMTDKPNIARKQEYIVPWITSQFGVAAKTYRKVAEIISEGIGHILKSFIVTIVINGARVHDPGKTSTGFSRGLIDALPQCLEPSK